MKKSLLVLALSFVGFVLQLTSGQLFAAEEQKPKQLKPAIAADQAEKTRTLGIVILPGFELLDAYGPLEMWVNLKAKVKIVVVAREKGEVSSSQRPKTVAEFGFKDCPP